jgi:putative membrane protein
MAWMAGAAVVMVALSHLYFMALEMFLWRSPATRRAFGTTAKFAEASAVLAANQGLYNGFLAAGLLWGLGAYGLRDGRAILSFFLGCVVVAGLYGAATASRRILWVQAAPGALALGLLWAL